jgi:hypothetical protein
MIPHMAVALGDYDQVEDILAKAGMGTLDAGYTFEQGSEVGVWDAYDNKIPASWPDTNYGLLLSDLLHDLDAMMGYHIIFFPCSYNANWDFMLEEAVIDNVRDYVWAGGKIYVSDYGYYVVDMVWNDFLHFLGYGGDTCAEAASPSGCNHGPPFDSPATVDDALMHEWIDLIVADTPDPLDDDLVMAENWDTIGAIAPGVVGEDPESGDPISQEPKVWVEGPWAYDADDLPDPDFDVETPHPLTVSWPYNCGRVIYTTYHTVGATGGGQHAGLYSQEMLLYFLVMELGVCQDDVPVIE